MAISLVILSSPYNYTNRVTQRRGLGLWREPGPGLAFVSPMVYHGYDHAVTSVKRRHAWRLICIKA